MNKKTKNIWNLVLNLAFILILTSCGGGGSGGALQADLGIDLDPSVSLGQNLDGIWKLIPTVTAEDCSSSALFSDQTETTSETTEFIHLYLSDGLDGGCEMLGMSQFDHLQDYDYGCESSGVEFLINERLVYGEDVPGYGYCELVITQQIYGADYDGDGTMIGEFDFVVSSQGQCPIEISSVACSVQGSMVAVHLPMEPIDDELLGDLSFISPIDNDQDGYFNDFDNCPAVTNQDQLDSNDNGIGDVCEEVVAEDVE